LARWPGQVKTQDPELRSFEEQQIMSAIKIVSLPGDGIGPEVTEQAVRVLKAVCQEAGRPIEIVEMLMGGIALDQGKASLPDETRRACLEADAVLLGAVGLPKYDGVSGDRPEVGLLALRKALGVFANLRPVRSIPALLQASPLKEEIVSGTDMLVVRELLGGIYFGEPRGNDGHRAFNTMVYTREEIERVARIAFENARKRRNKVTSVDKANVLEVSQLWRNTVKALHAAEYSDVLLDHQYVDSAAMDLIKNPRRFDVIVTSNLFGDILTDAAAVLPGSIGVLASASLGDGPGLFEPIHGSAPDIAGKGIANPLGAIGSVAWMLNTTLGLPELGARVDRAIDQVLAQGARTRDLGGDLSTTQMGNAICQAIQSP
jgi:3-isopropylmalate dehydrogenase